MLRKNNGHLYGRLVLSEEEDHNTYLKQRKENGEKVVIDFSESGRNIKIFLDKKRQIIDEYYRDYVIIESGNVNFSVVKTKDFIDKGRIKLGSAQELGSPWRYKTEKVVYVATSILLDNENGECHAVTDKCGDVFYIHVMDEDFKDEVDVYYGESETILIPQVGKTYSFNELYQVGKEVNDSTKKVTFENIQKVEKVEERLYKLTDFETFGKKSIAFVFIKEATESELEPKLYNRSDFTVDEIMEEFDLRNCFLINRILKELEEVGVFIKDGDRYHQSAKTLEFLEFMKRDEQDFLDQGFNPLTAKNFREIFDKVFESLD